ncbi:hypothetical protein NQ315_004959 [Exocentrus adspersus]|uniref:Uncharacterized protein n=1 Tax=Exocentrus adspersus TaxID=1586481 RepID=A0AAV8W2V3_9CUCU|nr:hypothetical protein NQ315_004959 [Exocentrus adspersus]
MLRKTNFRRDSRDSLKNAVEAMRRFSVTKELDKTVEIVVNGSDIEEPIVYKPVELEILPGLFISGVEVDL